MTQRKCDPDDQTRFQRCLLRLEQSLSFFSDSSKKAKIQIELAAIVDYGKPFVKATYKLEGDGPLALECCEAVETVSHSVGLAYAPNVEAVAKKLSRGLQTVKQRSRADLGGGGGGGGGAWGAEAPPPSKILQ